MTDSLISRARSIGGGGFTFGPEQHDFGTDTTTDRAAAETLRDMYAGANADWLAEYNGNLNFFIRLIWSAGSIIQRRNEAGNAWEDVVNVIAGPAGVDGQGVPVGGTDGQILAKASDIDFDTEWIGQTGGGSEGITDTIYFGTSTDDTPESAELTVTGTNGVGTIPAYAGEMHLLIARIATESDISIVTFSDDDSMTPQPGAFSKYATTVIPPSEADAFNVWVSNQILTQPENLTITIG